MMTRWPTLAVYLALLIGCAGDDALITPAIIPEPENFGQVSDSALIAAVENARNSVESNPESAGAWAQLGHVYQAHEWEEAAVQCYRRATQLEPRNYRWFYYLGRSLETVDPGAAADALSRAITLNDVYAPAHLYRAFALRSLKEFDEAKLELERVERLEPGNSFSELGLGELALAERDIEGARRHLEEALVRNPDQSATHAALAKVYMASGDRERARSHAALAGKPSSHKAIPDPLWREVEMAGVTPKWLIYQGRLALRDGDYEKALSRFEKALSASERDPKIWLDYGAALLGSGDYDRSIENLKKALALVEGNGGAEEYPIPAGDHAMLYNNLGLAYEHLNELELAEQYFRSAIKTSPPDSAQQAIATNNLLAFFVRTGAAYEKSGALNRAASYFSRGLEVSPQSVLLLNNLAVVYRRQGRVREALELVERSLAIRRDPRTQRMLEILSKETGNSKS